MTASIEQGLEAQTGTDVTLNDVEFSTYHVGPCEAYRISYTVELNGLNIMQICVGVSGLYHLVHRYDGRQPRRCF